MVVLNRMEVKLSIMDVDLVPFFNDIKDDTDDVACCYLKVNIWTPFSVSIQTQCICAVAFHLSMGDNNIKPFLYSDYKS